MHRSFCPALTRNKRQRHSVHALAAKTCAQSSCQVSTIFSNLKPDTYSMILSQDIEIRMKCNIIRKDFIRRPTTFNISVRYNTVSVGSATSCIGVVTMHDVGVDVGVENEVFQRILT